MTIFEVNNTIRKDRLILTLASAEYDLQTRDTIILHPSEETGWITDVVVEGESLVVTVAPLALEGIFKSLDAVSGISRYYW